MPCLLVLVGIAATVFSIAANAAAPTTRPNIVILLADDLGWADLHTGATSDGHGSSYHQTPNIDRLASQGMSFTAMHACPNCAPSRAELMTGQYSVHNGVYNVGSLHRGKGLLQPPEQRQHITHEAVTVAETLKTVGYTTAHVAKFHVSNHEEITQYDGFDFNYGGGAAGDGGPGGYFAVKTDGLWHFKNLGPEMNAFAAPYTEGYIKKNLTADATGNDPSSLVGTPKHLTDATADAALDFMSKHLASPERDKPFFINVGFNAVHTKLVPRSDLLAKFNKLPSSDPHHANVQYAALLEGEDQAIGRILRFLDEHGLADKTLVIFMSDNGGWAGSTDNYPLRGSKGMFYEGGLCVPLIARWPGVIAAGASSNVLLSITDLYPTFAELAGAALPDPSVHQVDGKSFAPVLLGHAATVHRAPIYYHFPGYLDTRAYPCSVIVKDLTDGQRFKLLYSYEDEHYELYDLSKDISEAHDLLKDGKAQAADLAMAKNLRDDLVAWLGNTKPAPLWAADKKTGKPTPPPIPLDQAMASGNVIKRTMSFRGGEGE